MGVMTATTGSPNEPHASHALPPLELWRARGATDELRALAFETSFGYALGLELDHELVLLFLQPSLEVLVAYADRIEAALPALGWQRLNTHQPSTKEPA